MLVEPASRTPGTSPTGYSITVEQCETMLDAFVAAESEPEMVMFSGGEPTIHKDILAMIDLAQAKPIKTVNLNTNGLRLASEKRFVRALGERNGRGGKRWSMISGSSRAPLAVVSAQAGGRRR